MRINYIIMFILWLTCAVGAYSGGNGESANPYGIGSVADWQELMSEPNDWNKQFVMVADVNLQGVVLSPVGDSAVHFSGVFNGNNYVVRNAKIIKDVNTAGGNFAGLFGCVSGGRISNLGVADADMSGHYYVGGLAGYSRQSVINACFVTGKVKGHLGVGGIVGVNFSGNVTNCHSTSTVSGNINVGGIAGINAASDIIDCYSAGAVSGGSNVGGLVGSQSGGNIESSFWNIETSGIANSAGGIGKTTKEMKMVSTFWSAGWDFVNVWDIGEGQTYPFLRKYSGSDLNNDRRTNLKDLNLLAGNWLAEN